MRNIILSNVYRSFEVFIEAATSVNMGSSFSTSFDNSLATLATTFRTTAILEAGRRSLDQGVVIKILYENTDHPCRPTGLQP